jgi:hypothetical protein
MPVHDPRDPTRSPRRHTPSYSSTASESPRGSLFETTDISSSHHTGSIRIASSPHAARPALRSTPSDSHRRVSRPSTLHRVTSGIRRLAFEDSPDEWTVFSEAMAHEVPQSQSTPPAREPLSLSLPAPSVGGESGQLTYSPVSELLHEEQFPTAAAAVEEEEEEGSIGQHVNNVDAEAEPPTKDTIRRDSKSTSGRRSLLARVPALPTLYRNILKCSLAYFIGSLFTYYTPLSRFIVELTQDGPGEKYPSATGHMVATVYVLP